MMLATEQGWRALLTSSLSFCLLRTTHWLPTGFAQRTPGGFSPFPIVPWLPPLQILSGGGGKTWQRAGLYPTLSMSALSLNPRT